MKNTRVPRKRISFFNRIFLDFLQASKRRLSSSPAKFRFKIYKWGHNVTRGSKVVAAKIPERGSRMPSPLNANTFFSELLERNHSKKKSFLLEFSPFDRTHKNFLKDDYQWTTAGRKSVFALWRSREKWTIAYLCETEVGPPAVLLLTTGGSLLCTLYKPEFNAVIMF